jgi:transposase InsO family protein
MPNRVITDLGSPFTAIEFKSWAQDCGISIDYASVAHPKANGQVERANRLILAGLKLRLYEELEDYGSKWIEELSKVVWGLRTQVSRGRRYELIVRNSWHIASCEDSTPKKHRIDSSTARKHYVIKIHDLSNNDNVPHQHLSY